MLSVTEILSWRESPFWDIVLVLVLDPLGNAIYRFYFSRTSTRTTTRTRFN